MSFTKSPTRLTPVLVVAGITVFLLGRLSNLAPAAPPTPTPSPPVFDRLPVEPVPLLADSANLSIPPPIREGLLAQPTPVEEETTRKSVTRFAATLKTAQQVPAHWTIAFENSREDVADGREDRKDIWMANSDGTNQRRILTDAQQPSWSPDRKQLAFVRRGNIWMANAKGRQVRQLTFWQEKSDEDGYYPIIRGISWNRKDNLISFARDERFQVRREYSQGKDWAYGTTLHHVSLKATAPRDKRFPYAVPPDQTSTYWEEGKWNDKPHSVPRFDVTERYSRFSFSSNAFPAWSTDGDKLLFARNGDIFLAERLIDRYAPDSHNWDVKRLFANATYDGHTLGSSRWSVATNGISWGPDGAFFVYTYHRMGGSGIAGATLVRKRITKDSDGYESEDWVVDDAVTYPYAYHACVSPDGKWVLFNGNDREAVAVSVDGKQPETILKYAPKAAW